MSWWEWMVGFMLLSLYITCLFTVCSMTFQKGRTVLGIVGIFAPLAVADRRLPAGQEGLALRDGAADGLPGAGGAVLGNRRVAPSRPPTHRFRLSRRSMPCMEYLGVSSSSGAASC